MDSFNEVYHTISVDFEKLAKFNIKASEDLLEQPDTTIKAAELAIQNMGLPDGIEEVKVRFFNLPDSVEIKISHARTRHISKLLKFKGIVKTKSEIRPKCVLANFECPSCGNIIELAQLEKKFNEPSMCSSCGRKGKFKLADKKLIDAQILDLEEGHEDIGGSTQPKKLKMILFSDLVSPFNDKKTNPGMKIEVVGILKEVPIEGKSGAKTVNYDLLIEGNNYISLSEDFDDIKITKEEEKKIKELANDKDVFEKITNSLCPTIYGYDRVKQALVLQLFGGSRKMRPDGVSTRGDMHILLIGDPGAGKTQIMRRMAVVAPKSKSVSGKGTTGAGLTASVIRDEMTGSWSLEAGAMVLANNGFCFIDEMDKMTTEDRSAMHECLEQQTVTIAKANIQATLRCETTVLAAANPKFGRFDPYAPINDQIDLPPALISRFDLIFPIKDVPDRFKDDLLADFILKIHQTNTFDAPPIETELIRKFVAYSRKTCNPQLSVEALAEIKKYYVEMRSSGISEDGSVRGVAITTRQLEGLLRLAEASAKTRLSETVDFSDARIAIDLLHHCLSEIALDKETGKIDIDKISSVGMSQSQRSKIMNLNKIIKELEDEVGKVIPIDDILKKAEKLGLDVSEIEEGLEKLKRTGDIYEPKRGFYSRL